MSKIKLILADYLGQEPDQEACDILFVQCI
jgi:hypothetical protein